MTDSTAERAFVLGLDGVPWNLLDRFTADGDLPNLARMRDDGVAGPLHSTVPPNTPIAWPSIASGKRADAHGLYEFFRVESDYSQYPATSDDVRAPLLWHLLEPAVVGNVPMTYPAESVDGRMVTGMMSPGLDADATHPSSLADRIDAEVPDYEVGLDWSEYEGRPDEFRADIADLVATRKDLLDFLAETPEWRLFFFVFTAPDRLQHLLWDEAVIRDHYRQLDAVVGDVMDYCEERDATLYVVSDHGFGPAQRIVYPNRALANAGLLSEKDDSGTRGALATVGVTKDRVLSTLNGVGVTKATIARTLPDRVVDAVATRVPGSNARFDVDYGDTRAFFHGLGSVYVNDTARFADGTVPPEDRDRVGERVRSLLAGLEDPETGRTALEVLDGGDVFPRDDRSPDLVVRAADGYHVSAALKPDPFADTGTISATHRSEGVFLAWGPDVASGVELDDATVFDVAPTLLHGLGDPVPADADGDPLFEAYAPGSGPATTEPRTTAHGDGESTGEGIEEFDDVEDRLRGLGYVE